MKIIIENVRNNTTVPCCLALLRGCCEDAGGNPCTCPQALQIRNSRSPGDSASWPVIGRRFSALIRLCKGANVVELLNGSDSTTISLHYQPPKVDCFVRLVYIICRGDSGRFQTPKGMEGSVESACSRLKVAALMLQTFFAEKLLDQGLGRFTFQLESDDNGPLCQVFHISLTRKEAQSLSPAELWRQIGLELVSSDPSDVQRCKFMAFVSFTEYLNPDNVIPTSHQQILDLTKGNVFLGGGGLALLGTGCLFTWPSELSQIVSCFTDTTMVDRRYLMDDSANRGQYWACYSSTLGATAHELGHIFGLGHTPSGIMARGFDDIHLFFMHSFSRQLGLCAVHHCRSCAPTNDDTLKQVNNGDIDNTNRNILTNVDKQNANVQRHEGVNVVPRQLKSSIFNVCINAPTAGSRSGPFWYRPSAIILRYHKWFNAVCHSADKNPPAIDGLLLTSKNGMRIIELRNAQGTTIHYWEFLHARGATMFLIKLDQVPPAKLTTQVTVVVEDSCGNMLSTKLSSTL